MKSKILLNAFLERNSYKENYEFYHQYKNAIDPNNNNVLDQNQLHHKPCEFISLTDESETETSTPLSLPQKSIFTRGKKKPLPCPVKKPNPAQGLPQPKKIKMIFNEKQVSTSSPGHHNPSPIFPLEGGCSRTTGFKIIKKYKALVNPLGASDELSQRGSVNSSVVSSCLTLSSRQKRAQNRHLLLSLGLSTELPPDLAHFLALQTRTKSSLKVFKSSIHSWGLLTLVSIPRNEFILPYLGEIISLRIAEKREKLYTQQGIDSSYMFKLDDFLLVDATKYGNLARFINHSCNPNCIAKIVSFGGGGSRAESSSSGNNALTTNEHSEKKIFIYAKRDIKVGEELTYDYKFPFEEVKIICRCQSNNCRRTLN